jgi:hypothetical protein
LHLVNTCLNQCVSLKINPKTNHLKHSEAGFGFRKICRIQKKWHKHFFLAKVQFSTPKQHIFCHKNALFLKGHDQKMFGPLFRIQHTFLMPKPLSECLG